MNKKQNRIERIFEIDQEYYDKQEKRFNDFKSQLRLF